MPSSSPSLSKTTTRTTKPRNDARRGLARAAAALLALALALALAACTAPKPPPALGDVPDGPRFARDAAAALLTLSAYDYALAGALGGERTRIVALDRYATVARSVARRLGTLTAGAVAVSASASGPVRDRLVPLADALSDLAQDANAYADGREPAAFARVIALVALSWDRVRELAGVLPPDDALVRTLARGGALVASAREETRAVLTVGPYPTRAEADDAAQRIGAVERIDGPPFVLRVASFASRSAADAAGAALAPKGVPAWLVVDEPRWTFTRSGPVPDAELWREPVRTFEGLAGTRRVALSSDGAWLAIGADDGTIALFSGEGALRALPKLRVGIAHLVFSDDAKQLIGGGVNLSIFAVPQGSPLGSTLALTSPATQVVFAPAPGARAFVASSKGPTGQAGGGGGAVNARAPDGAVLGAPFPIVTPAAGAILAATEAGELYVATPGADGATTDIETFRLGLERTLRGVARVPGSARALTIDRTGTLGAILTDRGVYRFGPRDGDPPKTVSRVLDQVRDIAFGTDGVLYALDAKSLSALDRGGALLWSAPLTDGRRLLAAARTVVLDGPDRLVVVGPGGALDELGTGGAVQDVAMSLGGRRVAAVVESRRALLFELQ